MFRKNIAGLCWPVIFNFDKKEADRVLSRAREMNSGNTGIDSFYTLVCAEYGDKEFPCPEEFKLRDDALEQACYIATLKFCLEDTTFASDVLTEEEYQKALNLFERGQYNSALLKNLAAKSEALHYGEGAQGLLLKLLQAPVGRIAEELREEIVVKSLKELKAVVDGITSGVKSECYLAAVNPTGYHYYVERLNSFDGELAKFIDEKYGYRFNERGYYYDYDVRSYEVLKRALFNDEKFWAEHKQFDIFVFVNAVKDYNDVSRAQKLLTAILDKIAAHPVGAELLKKRMPLAYVFEEGFVKFLNKRTENSISKYFNGEYDISGVNANWLVYPLKGTQNGEKLIAEGKEISDRFFSALYGAEADKVKEFLRKQLESGAHVKVAARDDVIVMGDLTVTDMFEDCTFGGGWDRNSKEAVKIYCPGYFLADNVLKRFYLKAYALKKALKTDSKCFTALFEHFYNIFRYVECQTGLQNAHQLDAEGRNGAYEKLCAILGKYAVKPSDKCKRLYVAALLDRKVATGEEAKLFPELEQLGDAVYNLAVAEMLYYDPGMHDTKDDFGKDFEDHIRAEAQIKICTAIGLDKLYLSVASTCGKYSFDLFDGAEDFNEINSYGNDESSDRFYADSLEMVIGAICKDCGYRAAINFSKAVIKNSYPGFNEEVRWTGDTSAAPYWFWRVMYPGRFSSLREEVDLSKLHRSFDKFFLAYNLGTESAQTRKFITYNHGSGEVYGEGNGRDVVGVVFYEYLHYGLEAAVEKFGNAVKENYLKSHYNKID